MTRVSRVFCGSIQDDETMLVVLESSESKGAVLVNGKPIRKNSSVLINAGDELTFSRPSRHAYVSFCLLFSCIYFPCIFGLSVFTV